MQLFRRHDGRYYAIGAPLRDLCGDMVVQVFYGSVHSRLGGVTTRPASEAGRLAKTRLAHGYEAQLNNELKGQDHL